MKDPTIEELNKRVQYLSRRLNINFRLDVNAGKYKVVEVFPSGGIHELNGNKMTINEMRHFLDGMIVCIDAYATAGV